MRRLRGPGGITVEQVELRGQGRAPAAGAAGCGGTASHLGDFSSVEELAKVIDVSELVEEDDPGQAAAPPNGS